MDEEKECKPFFCAEYNCMQMLTLKEWQSQEKFCTEHLKTPKENPEGCER